jgi:regulator of protease activity HflC (stomatin/prohibitin superfamily)
LIVFRKYHVRKDERGLLFRKGDFVTILRPGEHRVFDPLRRTRIEKYTLETPLFEHRLAEYLRASEPALVERELHVVDVGPREAGLLYENGALVEVLGPDTRRLYWKGFVDVRVDKVDIGSEAEVAPELARRILATGQRLKPVGSVEAILPVIVPEHSVAVLHVDGKVEKLLQAGLHAFWKFRRDVRAEVVDLRLQVMEVAGQEILTRDKVTLRVNLNAGYRVSDVLTAFAKHAKPQDFLYKELQFGLRAAVGTRTLDELLENKGVIDEVVEAHIRRRIAGFGLEVESVGVKDIILPGEMKVILAKVVEAEKAAQANVIRRREETAATRSLLNTAKVMEDNPTALRLKELETLEKVTEKIDRISVFSGIDGVMKDLVKIR